MRPLAFPGALVVVDDCEDPEVRAAWLFAVKLGVVDPRHEGLSGKGACAGLYTRN